MLTAMMKLRLTEEACGCSVLRGGGGFKVRARLCLPTLEWRVLAATRIRHLQVFGFATEPSP